MSKMLVLLAAVFLFFQCPVCVTGTSRLLSIHTKMISHRQPRNHQIWIYSDNGADAGCINNVLVTFNSIINLNLYKLKLVYSNDIIKILPKLSIYSQPKFIIFPGGGDIEYHNKLKGIGCNNIRNYIFNGGNYLGFCAQFRLQSMLF